MVPVSKLSSLSEESEEKTIADDEETIAVGTGQCCELSHQLTNALTYRLSHQPAAYRPGLQAGLDGSSEGGRTLLRLITMEGFDFVLPPVIASRRLPLRSISDTLVA